MSLHNTKVGKSMLPNSKQAMLRWEGHVRGTLYCPRSRLKRSLRLNNYAFAVCPILQIYTWIRWCQPLLEGYILRHLMVTAQTLLLIVFSACGGIRTRRSMPVLTVYFPRWFRASWQRVDCPWHHHWRLPYWALLPKLEQVVPIYSSVADCQALTWLQTH